MNKLYCSKCKKHVRYHTIDTRPTKKWIRRLKVCRENKKHRFRTYEMVASEVVNLIRLEKLSDRLKKAAFKLIDITEIRNAREK